MISSLSGYQCIVGDTQTESCPRGDLNRIEITGNDFINTFDPVYGEPIAWLQECLVSRSDASAFAFASNHIGAIKYFSRYLYGDDCVKHIIGAFNSMSGWPFISKSKATAGEEAGMRTTDELQNANTGFVVGSSEAVTLQALSSGDPLNNNSSLSEAAYYMRNFDRLVATEVYLMATTIVLSGDSENLGWDPPLPSVYGGSKLIHIEKRLGVYDPDYEMWMSYYCNYWIESGTDTFTVNIFTPAYHVDYYFPIFVIRYEWFEYYGDSTARRQIYYTFYVGSRHYSPAASITVDLTDAKGAKYPGYIHYTNAPSGHSPGTTYESYVKHSIERIYLVAVMKDEVNIC